MAYAGKLKTQLWWWLSKGKPFVINDEYKLELLYIDTENLSAKIMITNLKTGTTQEAACECSCEGGCDCKGDSDGQEC